MSKKIIGVIGAGTMGNGIAHVFAQAGFQVLLADVDQAFVNKGLATISKNLQRGVDKERMTAEEKDAILARVKGTVELNDLAPCDLVIEAIVEKLEIKTELFQKLDRILGEHAILASNTSSISITKLAAATSRPDKFDEVGGNHSRDCH